MFESMSWLNEMFMSWLSQTLPPVARSFIAYLGDRMDALLLPLIFWFALYLAIRHGPNLISRPTPGPETLHYKPMTKCKRKWKHRKPRLVPGSIKDHGLNKQYPRRLRSNGWYYKTPPTFETRKLQAHWNALLWRVDHVEAQAYCLA